jgi:hypothetical protein
MQLGNGDVILTGELIHAQYLVGGAPPDEDGHVVTVGVHGISVEGRLLLQRLRKEDFEESWRGFFSKHGSFAVGILFGALMTIGSTVVGEWLKNLLGL